MTSVGSRGLLLDRDASTLSWGSASTTAGSWSLSGHRYMLSILDVGSSVCVLLVVVDAAAPCSFSSDSELVTREFVAISKLD